MPRASAREGPRKPIILYLFSGPLERAGGFASCLKSLGLECEEWDVVNGEHFDLTDGEIWLKTQAAHRRRRVRRSFAGPSLQFILQRP